MINYVKVKREIHVGANPGTKYLARLWRNEDVSLDTIAQEISDATTVSYPDVLAALKALHEAGCKTWVSMEPYPTPNMVKQDLKELLEEVSFTDRIIFGRTNYSKVANAYEGHKHFYNECAAEVISFCQERGIDYHIKKKTITEE